MGDKGAKKTNKMLEGQTNRANDYSERLGQAGNQERAFQTGLRQDILNKYNNIYASFDQPDSGGGGGGGGYTPPAFTAPNRLPTIELKHNDPRFNEAREGFKTFADTGGFTQGEAADFRARGTATLPAFFEGLKLQQAAANRAAGGNIGFNSQMAKLAREQAFGANRAALETEGELADRIREGKRFGIEGVSRLDESKIGREVGVEDKRNAELLRRNEEAKAEQLRQEAAAAAAQQEAAHWAQVNAGRARQSQEDDFARRMAVLGELRDLRGEQGTDLPYYDRELAGINTGTNSVANRVPETNFLDTLGQAAIGIGSAFIPGGGGFDLPGKKKVRDTYDYGGGGT